jgi:hypothetical protein
MQDYTLVEKELERGNAVAEKLHCEKYEKLKEIVGL